MKSGQSIDMQSRVKSDQVERRMRKVPMGSGWDDLGTSFVRRFRPDLSCNMSLGHFLVASNGMKWTIHDADNIPVVRDHLMEAGFETASDFFGGYTLRTFHCGQPVIGGCINRLPSTLQQTGKLGSFQVASLIQICSGCELRNKSSVNWAAWP